MSFFRLLSFGTIRIASPRDLRAYVARNTVFCVAVALACDVVNQMVFFEGWTAAVRSWAITVGIVVAVAIPLTRAAGAAHLKLFWASQTDPLTGLANRRAILDRADDPKFVALMIADIDRFKAVNDTYGHMAGDLVLKTVADIIRSELGRFGLVGRLGGEEFALVSMEGDERRLMARLEALRQAVARTPVLTEDGLQVTVTISAGVARRTAGQSFQQLYAEADQTLYAAKSSGRNRIMMAGAVLPAPEDAAREWPAVA